MTKALTAAQARLDAERAQKASVKKQKAAVREKERLRRLSSGYVPCPEDALKEADQLKLELAREAAMMADEPDLEIVNE